MNPVKSQPTLLTSYPDLFLCFQVHSNEPGVIYDLFEKEKLPRLPFSIDQNGVIYVTDPLDREEKDTVSKHIKPHQWERL